MKYAQKFSGRFSAGAHLSVILALLWLANGGSASGQTAEPSASPSAPAEAPAAQPPAAAAPAPATPSPAAPPPAAQAPAAPAPAAPPPVAQAPAVPEQPLSADDVSWLFPAPTKASDLANLIALSDLTVPNPADPSKRDRVWPDAIFQRFIGIAGQFGAVPAAGKIELPAAARTIDAWHIAGVRFDPGAPGLSDAIIKEYGQSPQIRLIVQPVTKDASGKVTVLDITAHLIFSFIQRDMPEGTQPGCFKRPVPDLVAFKQIVAEVAALRSKLRDGKLGTTKIATTGKALGVHPGLTDRTTASKVRVEMKALLERHLSPLRLFQMATMALPANQKDPWIFLAMQFVPPGLSPQLPNGGFAPVHGPTLDGTQFAQALLAAGTNPRVVPQPHTNNLAPITCVHAAMQVNAGPPIGDRKGVSTADLPAVLQTSPAGKAKVLNVLNTIADPDKSHFFNTDCVSCHTETRRAMELLPPGDRPKIAAAPLPNGTWNVRNFGWSPPIEGAVGGTVTRRTAAETKAAVDFINLKLLTK